MVVSNGFITNTEQDVLPELLKRCEGKDIRTIPIPCVHTMTYYVSEYGEVFGSQKMKNIMLYMRSVHLMDVLHLARKRKTEGIIFLNTKESVF